MAKIIVNCRYIKSGGKVAVNLIEYMGTRPGVEMNEQNPMRLNPATTKQAELIAQLEKSIPDFKTYFEYEDYIKNPNIENASALITAAMDYNLDMFATKENLIEYMGKRPGAERVGNHGLFGENESVEIHSAMNQVANHPGNIWTFVVSLRREDAERLGYNNQKSWRNLALSEINTLSKFMKIPLKQLVWFGAYHNESHHPHLHMTVFSKDAHSGYLSKKGIDKIRSGFAHEIFKQDFYQIYERKQTFHDDLNGYTKEYMIALIDEINSDNTSHPELERLLLDLADALKNHNGKKVYGFLKTSLKAKVDEVVRTLANDSRISELYKGWCECQNEIVKTYKIDPTNPPPLEKQLAFRSIHNAVIRAAEELNTEQKAQVFSTALNQGGAFLYPHDEKEENDSKAKQQWAKEKVESKEYFSQVETEEQFSVSQNENSLAKNVVPTSINKSAALAVTRLLRSLGNNVYNSYESGHRRLFRSGDRRQLKKELQKKIAQGHKHDGYKQTPQ